MGPSSLDSVSDLQRTLWVIFVAFCNSILIFGVVLFFVPQDASDASSHLRLPLAGVAALVAIASVLVMRHTRSAGFLQTLAPTSLPDGQPDLREFAIGLQTPTIIVLAMNEAVSLLGFVAGFLEQDVLVFVPFAVVALALNAGIAPRTAFWLDCARKAFPHVMWPTG